MNDLPLSQERVEINEDATNSLVLPVETLLDSYMLVINFISLNVLVSFAKIMIYYLDNLPISKGLENHLEWGMK